MGTHTKRKSAMQAGRDVGMSKHQIIQAIRIASIPEEEFEALIEDEKGPPTLTHLAEIGLGQRMGRAPVERERCKVEISEDLKAGLAAEAEARGLSLSGLLDDVIRYWLAHRV